MINAVIKIEEMQGKEGVSIYINGDLCKHTPHAVSLFVELAYLHSAEEVKVRYELPE